MSDLVTLTGLVATVPRHVVTSSGLPITSFRMVSQQRRFDRQQQKWIDGDANWYTVTTFRRLAIGAHRSLEKGHHVVLTGRLRVRDWESGERNGTTVEVEADALGHDLTWGTSAWTPHPSAGGESSRDREDAGASDGAALGEGAGDSTGPLPEGSGDEAWVPGAVEPAF